MSTTRSASVGMPYLKPKLMTVSWSPGVPSAAKLSWMMVASWWMFRSEVSMIMSLVSRNCSIRVRSAVIPSRRVPSPCSGCGRRTCSKRRTSSASVGFQEEHAHRRARSERFDGLFEVGEQFSAADVDDRGDSRQGVPGAGGEFNQRAQHLRREIVHDVPAEVFQRIADGGPTGSGHPGDNEYLAAVCVLDHRLAVAFGSGGGVPAYRCWRRREELGGLTRVVGD